MRLRLAALVACCAAATSCADVLGFGLDGYSGNDGGGGGTSTGSGTTSTGAGGASPCGVCPPGAWCDAEFLWCVPEWANWPLPSDSPAQGSYTLTPGTVTDPVTGLTWQRHTVINLNGSAYGWEPAHQYCKSLPLEGGNWRMPSAIELASLVDYSPFPGSGDSFIDAFAFSGERLSRTWAASCYGHLCPADPSDVLVWSVDFTTGRVDESLRGFAGGEVVRCVRPAPGRAAPPPGRFHDNGDGTVSDVQTKLVWQKAALANDAWALAQQDCHMNPGSLPGTGWRLPGVKELQSLLDRSRVSPAIDQTVFPGTPAEAFWTNVCAPAPNCASAWAVNFGIGTVFTSDATTTAWLRCVR